MTTRTLALFSLAAAAGMFFYSPAGPERRSFRDAPISASTGESSAFFRRNSLAALKPVVVAAEEGEGAELKTFQEPGDKAAAPSRTAAWQGQRCFDNGCLGWASDTGIVWNGEQCSSGGCAKWVSTAGVIWNGSRCSGDGCSWWTASNGSVWSGEECAGSGCRKWTSDTGRVLKGRRCLDSGCLGWTSDAGTSWEGGQCGEAGCRKWTAGTGDGEFLPFLNKQ